MTVAQRIGALVCLCCLAWAGATASEGVDFALPDLDQRVHRLADYRGQWVVVNFWATWCASCVQEMAELEQFHRAHRDRGAQVVGVNFEQIRVKALRDFVQELGISFPIVRAGEAPLVPFEPLKGLPTTFIVTPSGQIVARHLGPVTRLALEEFLARETDTE